MADNYILRESWGKPNIQEREYVAHNEAEKDAMLARGGIVVGDKVYVIASKKTYMLGFDNKWYDATTEGGSGGDVSGKADKVVGAVEGNLPALDSTGNLMDSGIAAEDVGVSMVEITHSDLCAAIGNGELVPGTKYRIIDYVTKIQGTIVHDDEPSNIWYTHWGRSIEEPFDIIVTAVADDLLDSNAQAIRHSNDSGYFQDCDLTRWELHYCPFNDTDQFRWADAENGKGVIYWMKDEWNNEAPYDFKNIQYLMYGLAPADPEADDPCGDINYDESQGQLQKYASAAWLDSDFPDAWNKQFYVGDDIWNTEYEPVVDQNYLDTYCADWYFTFDDTWFDSDPQTGTWTKAGQEDTSLFGGSYNNKILSSFYTDGPEIIIFITDGGVSDNSIYSGYNIVLSNCWNNQIEISSNSFILGHSNKIKPDNSELYVTGDEHSIGLGCYETMITGRSINISIGDYCDTVQLDNCENITIGDACSNIEMQAVYNTTIADECNSININPGCGGCTFGIGCENILLAQNCESIQFGNICNNIALINTQDLDPSIGVANINACIFDNFAQGIVLDSSFVPEDDEMRGGYHIHSGTYYAGDPSIVEVTESIDRTYPIEIGIRNNGTITKWIAADPASGAEAMVLTTYSELFNMVDNGQLTPGMKYCITDYTTIINGTLTQDDGQGNTLYFHHARSEEHPFNIIVTALDEYNLSEDAYAAHSDNDDGYFADSHLAAWRLKYTIYNNLDVFNWATPNGKGVIHWMADEFGNEAPYDFKNIQFLSYALTAADGENYDSFCYDGETNTFKYGSVYYLGQCATTFLSTGEYENPFPSSWNKDFYVGSDIIQTAYWNEVTDEYLDEFYAEWHFTFDYNDNGNHYDYSLNSQGALLCCNNIIKQQVCSGLVGVFPEVGVWLPGLGQNIYFCNSDMLIQNNVIDLSSCGNILTGSNNRLGVNSYGNIIGLMSNNNTLKTKCSGILLGAYNEYNTIGDSYTNLRNPDTTRYGNYIQDSSYVIDISEDVDLGDPTLEGINLSEYIQDFTPIYDALDDGRDIYLKFTWQEREYRVKGDFITYPNPTSDPNPNPTDFIFLFFNCNILEHVDGFVANESDHYQYIQHQLTLDLSSYIYE